MLASRTVILAMAERLVDAATSAGARVYTDNRNRAFQAWPALKLYPDNETFDAGAQEAINWPVLREHDLRVVVEGAVHDVDDVEGAMAALALEVLQALEGTLAAAELEPLEGVQISSRGIRYLPASDGEQATGTVRIEFQATFGTASDDPETFL